MYEKIELIISEYKLNRITKEKCLIELRNYIEQIIKQVDTKQLILHGDNELDCPYEFTSRCTMGRCGCKPKAN